MSEQTRGSVVTSPPSGRLGIGRGAALYVGAVLGPGVLALPQLAAAAAGPASILAWVGLLLLSVPVAFGFAALAARFPDGGGVATFARRAFGERAAVVVGWWFYAVIPVGAVSAAVIGSRYVAGALGWGSAGGGVIAVSLVALAFAGNHAGLRLSGGAQLLLMALLATVLAVAIVIAAPRVSVAHFVPFAPHGTSGVLSAAGVLFFAFAGWEAASHLSAEFGDPRRQLWRVTLIALTVVTILYLGLSIVSIGVLGGRAADTAVPLTAVLEVGFGPVAYPVTAAIAVVLSLGAMNTFIAGASRLGAALARDGAMPAGLAKGGGPGEVPHRSLVVLAALTAGTGAVAAGWQIDVDSLMRATSACLAAVTLTGMIAAVRLLPGRGHRIVAGIGAGFTLVVLLSLGGFLAVPLAVGLAALGYRRRRGHRLARAERVPV